MNKRQTFLLFAIVLLALALRLLGIATREIQYDDAFSVFLSARSLGQIVQGTAADTMPPLYYFVLHFWQQVSSNLVFLRLLSAILSVLILLITFDLVRRAWGWAPAAWTALLAAISPIQIYHAQDLRMYTLLVLGQMGYFWCFFRIFLEKEKIDRRAGLWLGLVLFGAVAMYSHNLAIFGLAVADLYLLFKRDWKALGGLLLAQLGIGLLALPWLVYLPGQIAKIQAAFWTPRPGLVEVFQALVQFTANLPLGTVPFAIVAILSLQILVLTVLEGWKLRGKINHLGFFACVALVPPVLLFIVSYLIRPVFVARGFLVASLGYYALIGLVVGRRWKKGVGPFLVGAFVLSVCISLPSFYTFEQFPRSPFRQAEAYLEGTSGPGDLILHENKLSFFPAYFYDRNPKQEFLADQPGSANDTYAPASQQAIGLIPQVDIQTATQGHSSVYFVLFTQAINEYRTAGEADPNLAWLDAHYDLAEKKVINDLEIYHYTRQP